MALHCLRPAGRANERVYYRTGELIGLPLNSVPLNAEVSYVMVPDPRGRQDMAAKIRILPYTLNTEQLTVVAGIRSFRFN